MLPAGEGAETRRARGENRPVLSAGRKSEHCNTGGPSIEKRHPSTKRRAERRQTRGHESQKQQQRDQKVADRPDHAVEGS